MAATLKQLRDQVIIDTGIEGNPKFPTTRLTRIINLAQRFVQIKLNGLGMKKWETSDSLTLSSGTFGATAVKTAPLSTDCPNMLESPDSIILIDCNDGESFGIAYPVDVRKFEEQLLNTYLTPTITKPSFMRLAQKIYLAPSSITSATAYYYDAITDLSSDSDTTEIPLEFEQFIIDKATMDVNEILGKLQDKTLATQELERDLASVYEKFISKNAEQNRASINDNAKLQ